MLIPTIGASYVYEQTTAGDILSLILGLGGLGAGGYHLPMLWLKKSRVCGNPFSYIIMALLAITSIALIIVSIV